MDKEQIVHDLTIACLNIRDLPPNLIEETTVNKYLATSAKIRKLLSESQDHQV